MKIFLFLILKYFRARNMVCFSAILLLTGMIMPKSTYGQLPECNKIYMDRATSLFPIAFAPNILSFNPSLPASATNPGINTIALPPNYYGGITVSPVLNSGNPTPTFYVLCGAVAPYAFYYYDPVSLTWINTGHTSPEPNIGAGGGFIYSVNATTNEVYKYDGTGNAVLVTTLTYANNIFPFADIVADCEGNWYTLSLGLNPLTFAITTDSLKKYDPSGNLLQAWKVNNPNGYALGAGFLVGSGFGIIQDSLYFDNTTATGGTQLISGSLNAAVVNLSSATAIFPGFTGIIGDLGTCSGGIPLTLSLSVQATPPSICLGDTVLYSADTAYGGTAPQLQWFVNGVPVTGATRDTFPYSPVASDQVTCKFVSNAKCVSPSEITSNPVSVIVSDTVPPRVTFNPDTSCQAGQGIPVIMPSGSIGSFIANPTGLSIDPVTGNIDFSTSAPGSYIVTYTSSTVDPVCAANVATNTIIVAGAPDASITPHFPDGKLCYNDTFSLSAPDQPGNHYLWSPDKYISGANGLPEVSVIALPPGVVEVSLTVTSAFGCIANGSFSKVPENCCSIFIPNAFSPNGDGLNDVFHIKLETALKINAFEIFNRWGERIFYSINQYKGWDGTFRNEPVESGTYFYFVSYTCTDGNTITKKGDLVLVR